MPRYYHPVSDARGRVRTSALEASSLFVLYTPERQVDTWLSHAGFLGHFVLEVLLRVASHDKEAAVRRSLRKCDGAISRLSLNRRPAPRLTEAITGPISGSASACRPTLSLPSRYRLQSKAL